MEMIRQFFRDTSGANMVEYALLITLIGVALITALTTLQGKINTAFTNAGNSIGGS